MELKIRDVAELLGVSEKTVYRWIKAEAIPVYKINHQYRFGRMEIQEWIASQHKTNSDDRSGNHEHPELRLGELVEQGGIYYKVEGADAGAVIRSAAKLIPVTFALEREQIVTQILERELIFPTAIGRGVAVPHPRSPAIPGTVGDRVSLAFLERPVDFGALDGVPVHSLFIVLSASQARHLYIFARINYLVHQTDFPLLLERQASRGEVLASLSELESGIAETTRALQH